MAHRNTSPSSPSAQSEHEQQSTSASTPSDDAIEKALRGNVAAIFKSGSLYELTVRRMRTEAEKILGLDEGFLKADTQWKAKSDHIIKDEVVWRNMPMHNVRWKCSC